MSAVWSKCNSCDEFVCAYHKTHAFECKCPGIGVWDHYGYSPYDTHLTDEVARLINANEYDEEEDG